MVSVHRLSARAWLDDSPDTLRRAQTDAAAGDESWEQWLAEYRRGDAIVVRLELTLEVGDAQREQLRHSSTGFFIENDVHAPKVEQQIAEQASGDFVALGAALAARGAELGGYELGEMYVHVELDEEVRRRLAARRDRQRSRRATGPATDPA